MTTVKKEENNELTLQEKLMKIQQELKAPKDLTNKFGGYKYRSCESILESVKPLLAKTGTTVNLSDELVLVGERYYIKATAKLMDGKGYITSTAFAREPVEKRGMDDSQITGTASSYARKYALNGLFCIDDQKDADTDEYHKETNRKPATAAQQPRQTASLAQQRAGDDGWKKFYNNVAQAVSTVKNRAESDALYASYLKEYKQYQLDSDDNFKNIFNTRISQLPE